MYDTAISRDKEALDKCTPFAKHINDDITLTSLERTGKIKHDITSCKQEMENLSDGICTSNLPDLEGIIIFHRIFLYNFNFLSLLFLSLLNIEYTEY